MIEMHLRDSTYVIATIVTWVRTRGKSWGPEIRLGNGLNAGGMTVAELSNGRIY